MSQYTNLLLEIEFFEKFSSSIYGSFMLIIKEMFGWLVLISFNGS